MTRYFWQWLILIISAGFSCIMLHGKSINNEINYYELSLELIRSIIWLFMMFYISYTRHNRQIYLWLLIGCGSLFIGNNMNILDELSTFEASYYQEVEDLLFTFGILCAWFGLYQLIQQQITKNQILNIAANTDPLTGLLNRRSFNQNVENSTDNNPSAYLILDIDHFKQINDTYGHAAGDYVLTKLAKHISKSLRKQDRVARWGGEEFLIELKHCDSHTAQLKAEQLRALIERSNFHYSGQYLSVTVSIGIATVANQHLNRDEIINLADKALYQAKNGGRNRVVLASDLNQNE